MTNVCIRDLRIHRLRFERNHTFREIAEIVGLSVTRVRDIVFDTDVKLKKQLYRDLLIFTPEDKVELLFDNNRVIWGLQNIGVRTLGELVSIEYGKLVGRKNIGKKSLALIKQKMFELPFLPEEHWARGQTEE